MAAATLNPAIDKLDESSILYDLYTRLYDGMSAANKVDAPACVTMPPCEKNEDGTDKIDEDGALVIDQEAIAEGLQTYTTILMKNSAYMFANAIIATIAPNGGSGGGVSGTGFLARSGDTMQGTLGALYGFEAGYQNTKIFETVIDSDENKLAIITGNLQVSENVSIQGQLNLSDHGIFFGQNQSIWQDQTTLNIASQEIGLIGKVVVDGSINVGDVIIDETGISVGDKEFYHSGNCNKEDVDWTMHNGFVHGDLTVYGESFLSETLHAQGGFVFSLLEHDMMYTTLVDVTDESGVAAQKGQIVLNSDLSIINNHGIKFNDNYIVWVRDTDNIVSFSAPGCVMNLGDKGTDKDGTDLPTRYIALQADIKNYNGAYNIVTHDGSGNFPNGFSAGVANALGSSLETYYTGKDDYGVVFNDYVRFGSTAGPALFGSDNTLIGITPFIYVDDIPKQSTIAFGIYSETSSSLVYNPISKLDVAALHLGTTAEHFAFDKPVESATFAIKSSRYKTRLIEDALFFDDGKFIEGIESGLRFSQNSMFDGNLFSFNPGSSSISFSSGFAGSGWAIMEDNTAGGIHATFDSLTIRKKMRVYELEVRKISVTNGSLWVSDSCSGDEVRALN